MDESRSTQNQLFGFQALPDLFHADAGQFILLLSRDGNKFLQFYWDEAGNKLHPEKKVIPFGLNYEFLPAGGKRIIIMLTMPKPVQVGDILYLALMYRPDRVMLFGFLPDFTKVLTLINKGDEQGANLVEITRRLERIPVREIRLQSKEAFLGEVKKEMD